MTNLDFSIYQGKSTTKSFTLTNSNGSIYDLTGSTVRLDIWASGNPTRLFTISGTITLLTGIVAILITSTESVNQGLFDYKLIEVKSDDSEFVLVEGNLTVAPYLEQTLTIKAFIRGEFPTETSLSEDFINTKVIYYKYFLFEAANLPEPYISDDSSWSVQWRMLIAKLIAYDALVLALRGSIMAFSGSTTSEMGTTVKKIVTGPTEVEFGDPSSLIEKLLKPGLTGATALDGLITDLCGLANKLGVKVPPCKALKKVFVPQYHQYDDNTYISLTETVSISDTPSRG